MAKLEKPKIVLKLENSTFVFCGATLLRRKPSASLEVLEPLLFVRQTTRVKSRATP
jgi:hypothetical protein